jgi:predicted RNA-binding Zn ribbon-like protein
VAGDRGLPLRQRTGRELAGRLECGLLFLDTSRPGRRRWCSSTACGGKARAAAYRQRRQPPRRNALTVTVQN